METLNTYHTDTAYADILDFLGFKNFFFIFPNKTTTILKPLRINNINTWTVLSGSELPHAGIISLDSNGVSISLNVLISSENNDEYGIYRYLMTFTKALPNELISKIISYQKILENNNKRCEERYYIGLKDYNRFGLRTADQTFYYNHEIPVKFILNNISIHGAMITGEKAEIKISETVITLVFAFQHPEEYLMQKALAVHIEQKAEKLFRYSLRFLDPISIILQQRIYLYSSGSAVIVPPAS